MGLEQTDSVDFLGFDKATGMVQLTLIDDHDWSDERRHIELLQAKIYRYLDFVESGEVFERLEELDRPVPSTTPVNVQILAKHPLTGDGERFMVFVAEVAESSGSGLSWKHMS